MRFLLQKTCYRWISIWTAIQIFIHRLKMILFSQDSFSLQNWSTCLSSDDRIVCDNWSSSPAWVSFWCRLFSFLVNHFRHKLLQERFLINQHDTNLAFAFSVFFSSSKSFGWLCGDFFTILRAFVHSGKYLWLNLLIVEKGQSSIRHLILLINYCDATRIGPSPRRWLAHKVDNLYSIWLRKSLPHWISLRNFVRRNNVKATFLY